MPQKSLILAILLVPNICFAYLDPASGTAILQAVVAAVVGGLYFVKLYWGKIKQVFAKIKSKK